MKKIITAATVVGLLLIAAAAFAWDDPDSMVNYLDPTNAPVTAVPEHRGLMGLTETGLAGAAAGGMGENPDSMLFYLDPVNAPSERIPAGQARIVPDDPDSIINTLSPTGNPE